MLYAIQQASKKHSEKFLDKTVSGNRKWNTVDKERKRERE
jgi:hypothetical protein